MPMRLSTQLCSHPMIQDQMTVLCFRISVVISYLSFKQRRCLASHRKRKDSCAKFGDNSATSCLPLKCCHALDG